MRDYQWKSTLSGLIQSYIHTKHMTGFRFQCQERYLQHFDHFHYYNGYQGQELTKTMMDDFIYTEHERPSSHYNKEVVMNQFAFYLQKQGIPTYIPEIKTVLPRSRYIPHIYTADEIKRFFLAVDHYPVVQNSKRNTVDPLLFRFLYGTGVRLSESLNLRICDIRTDEAYALIRGAKNNKDRIVPLAPSLMERLSVYMQGFHRFSEPDAYLFPGKNGRMDCSTAYNHFSDYLLMADIPHTGNGPRIHDFRHGLAVACLKKWSLAGEDLTNLLPYLAAYMGHSDFRATQYYLRLTAELYPEIVRMTEAVFHDVIPEGDFTYEET